MEKSEVVKKRFESITNNAGVQEETKTLFYVFLEKVIYNTSNDYKQIITKNKKLIENLIKSCGTSNEKSNEIKNLKEFIFTLILDKCIYLSYINGNTRRKEYIEKSGYNTINKYNEYYNDLLNLSDSFGINLDEFCKKIQKEKEQKEKEQKEKEQKEKEQKEKEQKEQKENIQNLLKEQSLDENLINNILPENYEKFYNEFKQFLTNSSDFFKNNEEKKKEYLTLFVKTFKEYVNSDLKKKDDLIKELTNREIGLEFDENNDLVIDKDYLSDDTIKAKYENYKKIQIKPQKQISLMRNKLKLFCIENNINIDETLIDSIEEQNIKLLYNQQFKSFPNKQNKQNYIKYYIEIHSPQSEKFYIKDETVRENFLLKFQTLMEYMQPIGDKTLTKALNNPKHIADLPYNDNKILLIFAQNLPKTENEIEQFKNNFNKIYNNVFNRKRGRVKDYTNHKLGLFKYLIKNKKSVEESGTIIEKFRKIQEELNEVSNLGFIELMVKKVCDEQSKSNYYTENKGNIIKEFKNIQKKCLKINDPLIFEQIFGMFDKEHPNYIEEERNTVLEDIATRINAGVLKTHTAVQKYILANKGRVICGEDTEDVKTVIMEVLKESRDKEQQEIANKLDKGEYIIEYNGEGGSSIEKFKIVEKDSKKTVKFLKFYSSTEQSPASSGVIPSEANKITSTSKLIKESRLPISTSGLCTIINTQYNDKSIIMSDPAINPKEIKSNFVHNFQDGMDKALSGENNITYKNNNNTLGGILLENKSKPQFCINCIKSFYANIAVSSLFNFFDDRFDGNILLNSETGEFQVIDYDEEENLTIAGHGDEKTKPTKFGSERKCLKGKEVATNISELMINSYSGYFCAMDDIPLTAYEIITGEPAISQGGYKVQFSILNMIKEFEKEIDDIIEQGEIEEDTADTINAINKTIEELRELQNYQDCIARDMVILVETIDKEIEEILKKEQELKTKGEELSEKDEIHLGNCIEKRANAIAVFKTKTIGKHANELYKKQHEGRDIENVEVVFGKAEIQLNKKQQRKLISQKDKFDIPEEKDITQDKDLEVKMFKVSDLILNRYNNIISLKTK